MFTLWDLIYPIGLTLIATALGIWGAIVADTLPAQIVCGVFVAAVIGAAIGVYAWRARLRRADFVVMGLRVRLGKGASGIASVDLAEVLDDLMLFWADMQFEHNGVQYEPKSDVKILDALDGVFVNFLNAQKFKVTSLTFWLAGMYDYSGVWITELDADGEYDVDRITSLLRHELSHAILHRVWGVPGHEHHELFKNIKLGA